MSSWASRGLIGRASTAALTVVVLTGCSGGGGIPQLDAVRDTFNSSGPQFREDVCPDGVGRLAEATIAKYPESFLDNDIEAAAGWFLKSHSYDPEDSFTTGLRFKEGIYFSEAARAMLEEKASPYSVEEWVGVSDTFLGWLKPSSDPCG